MGGVDRRGPSRRIGGPRVVTFILGALIGAILIYLWLAFEEGDW
jgi:hypothetical protein